MHVTECGRRETSLQCCSNAGPPLSMGLAYADLVQTSNSGPPLSIGLACADLVYVFCLFPVIIDCYRLPYLPNQ